MRLRWLMLDPEFYPLSIYSEFCPLCIYPEFDLQLISIRGVAGFFALKFIAERS